VRLEKLEILNFRCFERAEWEFVPQVNLVVGDNGSGKTAILDALALGLGAFTAPLGAPYPREKPIGVLDDEARLILDDAVRIVSYDKGGVPTREPQFPLELRLNAQIDAYSDVLWGRTYLATRHWDDLWRGAANIGLMLRDGVQAGQDGTLPLVAYYRCQRLCTSDNLIFQSPRSKGPGSRLDGYADCLEASINQSDFQGWFRRLEFASMQRSETFGVLEGVRQAIIGCTEDVTNVTFDSLENELLFQFNDGRELPFRMLSDGYRNIVSLIADIAYRAAILNPQFEASAPHKTPGVVLIDEIDLHLHPTWQRVVIGKMIQTFPEIQFIMTTHAPLIIQSLEASSHAQLINLDPGLSSEFRHKSPEEIYEENQGIEHIERSARFRQMVETAAEYYKTLDQVPSASPERIEQLKSRLDELMLPFSDEPAYVAFLEMHREANPNTARSVNASH